MRLLWKPIVVAGLLAALGFFPLRAQQERQRDGAGITVFEDINFGGRNATFLRDMPDLRSSGFDRRISSLQVTRGDAWEVCDGRNYTGRCQVFSGSDPDLRARGWNDLISSLRQVRGGEGSGRGGQEGTASGGLELYAGTNYSGQRKVVSGPTRDLKDIGFNDRVMSVRVPRGQVWEICVSADYDDCRVIDRDYPDLSELGISRLASSVRLRASSGRGGHPPHGARAAIVLYDRAGFAGQSMAIDRVTGSLGSFTNRAGSVEVFGGRWELCDQADFRGHCTLVTRSVTDLGTLGLRDRVSSIRPR
jgi:hypothetical protein